MSQAAEVISYDYGPRKCLECGVMYQATYREQLTCGAECKKSRELKQERVRSKEARDKQKEYLATLEARVKELEAELAAKYAELKHSEAECADLRRALEAAKQELADMEQSYARLKDQFAEWKAKNGLDKPTATVKGLPPMQECKRMSLKATSLPCGQREECLKPEPCERLPEHLVGKKLCQHCRQPFEPGHHLQKYCSDKCRKRYQLGMAQACKEKGYEPYD